MNYVRSGGFSSMVQKAEAGSSSERLARTASLLNAALESTADGLLVVDSHGKIARYNQRFLALWRLGADLVQSGNDDALMTFAAEQVDDPEAFVRRAREYYADKDSQGLDVLTLKDGRIFERYTQPQRLEGVVVGRVWSFRDITQQEHLLRRTTLLSDASYLLGSLDVETALAGVADLAVRSFADACAVDLFSATGGGPRRIRSAVNARARALPSELSRSMLVQSPVVQSTASSSRMAIPLTMRNALLGVVTFSREHAAPAFDDADLACGVELARRAALAIENAKLYRAARDALHERDEFLAVAAHEIRGPLTVLRLAAQQLSRTRGLPDAADRPLSVIIQQDRRLARFVDELLDVSVIRARRTHLKLSDVDLGGVVRDAVAHLGPELEASSSSLTLSVEGHIVGFWDPAKVAQIVTQLLANAIKFGLSKPIEISASARDGVATLVVRDHGVGIPEERIKAIFDPFARAASARHYGGLGLGLYVVHELVTMMGGTIDVWSRLDEGSTFTVTLPQARSS